MNRTCRRLRRNTLMTGKGPKPTYLADMCGRYRGRDLIITTKLSAGTAYACLLTSLQRYARHSSTPHAGFLQMRQEHTAPQYVIRSRMVSESQQELAVIENRSCRLVGMYRAPSAGLILDFAPCRSRTAPRRGQRLPCIRWSMMRGESRVADRRNSKQTYLAWITASAT